MQLTVSDTLILLNLECILQDNEAEKNKWQKVLYKKIGRTKLAGVVELSQDKVLERVMCMAKVLHGLHMVS